MIAWPRETNSRYRLPMEENGKGPKYYDNNKYSRFWERESLNNSQDLSNSGNVGESDLNDWSFVFKKCIIWTWFISLIVLNLWVVLYLKPFDYDVANIKKTGGTYVALVDMHVG